MVRDPTEDIRVEIRGVSWISQAERGPRQSRGCAREPWFKHQPPHKDLQRQRDSGVGGERGGDGSNTNPPPLTKKDRDSGVAVSRAGVTQGKRENRAELGQTDSRERRMIRCRSAGEKYLFVRPCHRGAHSEDPTSSAHSEACSSSAHYRSLN